MRGFHSPFYLFYLSISKHISVRGCCLPKLVHHNKPFDPPTTGVRRQKKRGRGGNKVTQKEGKVSKSPAICLVEKNNVCYLIDFSVCVMPLVVSSV